MVALKVGQEVKVQVLDIDYDRKRISLTAKQGAQVNRSAAPTAGERPRSSGQGKPQAAPAPSPALKNNAFAGLKNLKL
jgi:predicted RNA-binding protein with RPS1 domain